RRLPNSSLIPFTTLFRSLWKRLPLAYAGFLAGGCALAALPLVTAGFFSKDEILSGAFASGHDGLLYAGLAGAFLTSLYTFRLILDRKSTRLNSSHVKISY